MDMSGYVLAMVQPALADTFAARVRACSDPLSTRFALADLNAFLSKLTPPELRLAVASLPPAVLTEHLGNYMAAMVEHACARAAIPPPSWTRTIKALREPYFGSALQSLRLYLLTHSPVPFRCRNLFIDASIGAQI
jgi:hypothetical protein